MLKYYDCAIVFQEIPDEITLAIEITSCPHRCHNCHSPWLREDIGKNLSATELMRIVNANPDITCVCFMGGDGNHEYIAYLSDVIHNNTNLKVAMYSGDDCVDDILLESLDYYKVGSYQEDKGPLSSETTNQKLYYIEEGKKLVDITYKMRKVTGGF